MAKTLEELQKELAETQAKLQEANEQKAAAVSDLLKTTEAFEALSAAVDSTGSSVTTQAPKPIETPKEALVIDKVKYKVNYATIIHNGIFYDIASLQLPENKDVLAAVVNSNSMLTAIK